jgi:hypothetical protein
MIQRIGSVVKSSSEGGFEMPYIERSRRPPLDEALEPVLKKVALGRTKGEMVYIFYRLALAWIRQQGQSFDSIDAAKAMLAATRDEIHDRYMRRHEDKKIAENGDVL